jgi:hypothetical protein
MEVSGQLDTPFAVPLRDEPRCLLNRMLGGPESVRVFLDRPIRSLDNTDYDIPPKFSENYCLFYASYL